MSSRSAGEREREACKWWGHGEREFFFSRGEREIKCKKEEKGRVEKQTIALKEAKAEGRGVIRSLLHPDLHKKHITSSNFCRNVFSPN